MNVRCPRCGKEAEMSGNPFRPFCSERCQAIDLGHWISGTYRIPEDGDKEEDADDGSLPHKDLNQE
jgi:endogenous inhibitor of DNA gyrase (YacG/DUF329 family)